MVLLYMVTWIPSIYPLYVSIYTSTMDPMGMGLGKLQYFTHLNLFWPFGDDSLYLNHDSSEGEQWGRYNLPRLVFYNHTITMNPPSIFRLYHICMYVCLSVCMYVCVCMYVYIIYLYIYIYTYVYIRRFPEMGVPLNHPFINGFSLINHPFRVPQI